MSRDANGNYTLPAGNPVIAGTIIDTAWANPTMDDLGAEMGDSLSRSGKGGMLTHLKLIDGTVGAPAYTFTNGLTSGLYRAALSDIRMSVAAHDIMRWTSSGVELWNFDRSEWLPIADTASFSNPNLFINGDFSVNQRGQSGAYLSGYALDRFALRDAGSVGGTMLVSQNIGGNGEGYYMNVQHTDATSSSYFTQNIEEDLTLQGVEITLSLKLNANDAFQGYYFIFWRELDATEASLIVQGPPTVIPSGLNTFSQTLTIPTITTYDNTKEYYLQVDFRYQGELSVPIGTNVFRFFEYKVERGAVATTFIPDDPATNLAKCERYYQSSRLDERYLDASHSTIFHTYILATVMRIPPTVIWADVNGVTSTGDSIVFADRITWRTLMGIDVSGWSRWSQTDYTLDAEL